MRRRYILEKVELKKGKVRWRVQRDFYTPGSPPVPTRAALPHIFRTEKRARRCLTDMIEADAHRHTYPEVLYRETHFCHEDGSNHWLFVGDRPG